MSRINIFFLFTLISLTGLSQETIYPAKPNTGTFYITGGTVHVGNGQVINNGTIEVTNSKITRVGAGINPAAGATVINATGQHVYPGLISANNDLGLKEIGSGARGMNDYNELGEFNPSIRSISAYNTDSKVINTLRSNGILLVNVVPKDPGNVNTSPWIVGSSTVVQLDAWNYEDAAYKVDAHMNVNIPSLLNRAPGGFGGFGGQQQQQVDRVKSGLDQISKIKSFFREAAAYHKQGEHQEVNLKFEALKPVFDKKQKLFVHCNAVREMLIAIDFRTELGLDVVIVGGSESWQIAPLLKQNNIPVILNELHALPSAVDDDVDQPYKTPYLLKQAGVLFAINDKKDDTRGKNLSFNAGTAVTYGLSKEEALSAITLDAAKILGISDVTGSIEVGKDANIIISAGDILDMKTSVVTKAFIQGRDVNLANKHTQLFDRYKHKYGL